LIACTTAAVNSLVDAVPPRSRVLVPPGDGRGDALLDARAGVGEARVVVRRKSPRFEGERHVAGQPAAALHLHHVLSRRRASGR
jgi:hypothetical protein